MTTIDDAREHQDPARAIDSAIDEGQVLQDEIDRLRQRVTDLELTVQEYRSQMTQVLSSASWKLTSPVRATASRYRTAKVKARRTAKRLKHGKGGSTGKVLTAGLFMPPLESLPETSPLRAKIDVNALRRPPEADGPLHRPEGEPTILVVAHVHYPELWGDIEDRLSRMPEAFDLLVTVTEGTAEAAIPRIMGRHPRARIEVVPNKGRDWAPLVRLANKGLLSGYDAVAKVHTKKSEHRIDGDGWRITLLDGVFESPDQIRRIVDLLKEDRSVGIVVPTGQVVGTEHWGSDQPHRGGPRLPPPDGLRPRRAQVPRRLHVLVPALAARAPRRPRHQRRPLRARGRPVRRDHRPRPRAPHRDLQHRRRHGHRRVDGCEPPAARLPQEPRERPNIYAFYLPQYHQCPENDEFWGEGFTDWVNVKKAKPLFEGHRQPILPSEEVGFYDLKDPEVLRKQAKMAKDHGIDGFVFHYYWFDGKKVLDTPLNNWLGGSDDRHAAGTVLGERAVDAAWDGSEDDVLIPQEYGEDWAKRFWEDISTLQDPVTSDSMARPVLVIYRSADTGSPEAVEPGKQVQISDGLLGTSVAPVVTSPIREAKWPASYRRRSAAVVPGSKHPK